MQKYKHESVFVSYKNAFPGSKKKGMLLGILFSEFLSGERYLRDSYPRGSHPLVSPFLTSSGHEAVTVNYLHTAISFWFLGKFLPFSFVKSEVKIKAGIFSLGLIQQENIYFFQIYVKNLWPNQSTLFPQHTKYKWTIWLLKLML